jgi:hypothetical protein
MTMSKPESSSAMAAWPRVEFLNDKGKNWKGATRNKSQVGCQCLASQLNFSLQLNLETKWGVETGTAQLEHKLPNFEPWNNEGF